MSEWDMDCLLHVEQRFYDTGYADGHAHGRLHGLIEGRALGREKGYELWEEIGFYEGFAKLWQCALREKRLCNGGGRDGNDDNDDGGTTNSNTRTDSHIAHLLELIAQFPQTNGGEVDMSALLNKIRGRYKALCASLGVKPRLRLADNTIATTTF